MLTIAKVGNLNSKDMNAYEQSLKIQRDNYSVRQAAVKDAKAEMAMEIAAELKKDGMPVEKIAMLTKLSEQEVHSL